MNIIGDIAGEYVALIKLLEKMPKQRTLLLGDLNDRGWESKQVIQYAIDNDIMRQGLILTLDSNHGDLFTDWFYQRTGMKNDARYEDGIFEMNGGRATLSSYGHDINNTRKEVLLADKVLCAHVEFLATRPKFFTEEINGQKYFFSHAPMNPNTHRTLEQFLKKGHLNDGDNGYVDFQNSYMWNRNEPFDFHRELPNTIAVFGHNAGKDLKLICEQYKDGIYIKGTDYLRNLLDINKGEVYGMCIDTSRDKKLTGLDLNTMTIYHENYPTEAKMY